jgi:hypothetical protein
MHADECMLMLLMLAVAIVVIYNTTNGAHV